MVKPLWILCYGLLIASLTDAEAQKSDCILISEEECYHLWNLGTGYNEVGKYRQAYDTLRAYVESCYNTTGSFFLSAFSDIGQSAQYMDPAPYHPDNMVAAREWFKKVLYYRDDTSYWCADVFAMLTTTFTYLEGRGRDVNANLAVIKFILDSNRCQMYEFFREFDWQKARDEQYKKWRDTVTDSLATPLDTTLPSLEEFGLGILRGKPAGVADEPVIVSRRLASVTASPNPFTDEVALKVELDASTVVRLDVYDELGRLMYGEGQGYKLKGTHELIVNGKGWSRGIYYARISASNGEVLTVKLVKE